VENHFWVAAEGHINCSDMWGVFSDFIAQQPFHTLLPGHRKPRINLWNAKARYLFDEIRQMQVQFKRMNGALTREQQLEDRLAALHRASLALVRETSLPTLLERIAQLAREQVGAEFAALGVLDEKGGLEQFIPIGMSADEVARLDHPPVGLGLIGVLMNTSESIRIPDISVDPRHVGFPEHHPPMKSFLGVPIRSGEVQLGQIYLTNKQDGPGFTLEDQQVIEMLGAYAGTAISNARLYRQLIERERVLTRRTETLTLLNDLASTLASSSDVDQILDKAITQVMDYLHIEVGEVYLRQEESSMLRLVLHRGDQVSRMWKQAEYRLGEGVVGQTAKSGLPRLISLPSPEGRDLDREAYKSMRQVICLPLTGRRGVLGVLCAASDHAQPLDELETQFLSTISAWMGTVIENVRLSLQQRRLAILEERERIGMDLHDGIIQSIYAVGLTLEHARLLMNETPDYARARIEQAITDLNSTIRDIRTYILDLRPRQLHDEDLMQGLSRLVKEFQANSLVEIKLEGPPNGDIKLPQAHAVTLFHICQEALANIAKHAHAQHVDVVLWSTPERVLLEIRDDGHGFDLGKVQSALGHGLSNMVTRARNVGGDVEITSDPKEGTVILAWVPFISE
jgi:two-component system sensor histidine kinase DevS